MRHFPFFSFCALALLLVPLASGREIQELRERVRDAVQRADKDLGTLVHRDKLNGEQRQKFDSAVKDLTALREAVEAKESKQWEGERALLERAADNMESLQKNAPIEDKDRQMLGIDVYTLHVILDSW